MSFTYGSKSRRHKSSGGHFKLFSDELPQMDFDKASLEELSARLNKNENRRSRGRRRTFRDSNHDRVSLPSLSTPEWEKMSDSEKLRPASYSSTNPLNPNFTKIHQKIQRRHTLKETKIHNWNKKDINQGYPMVRRNNENKVDKHDYISAWQEITQDSHNKFDYTLERLSEEVHHNENKADDNKVKHVVVEEPTTLKKKSVFKELLDAASKENTRMNQIKEGLNFSSDGYLRRHYSLRSLPASPNKVSGDHQINIKDQRQSIDLEKRANHDPENVVPEVISVPGKTKPGILKHGARVRESQMLNSHPKPVIPVKPRLVHHDDLPHFGQDKTPPLNVNDVKVSVHTAAPLNRVEDLVFVPLPSNKTNGKQKRVNFNEKIDIKEKTAVSDFVETNEENIDHSEDSPKETRPILDTDSDSVKVIEDDIVEGTCPRVTSTQIRRRANVRYNREPPKTKEFVSIIRRHPSIDSSSGRKTTIVPRITKHSTVSKEYVESIYSPKLQSMKSNDLRKDPAWKEARSETNDDDNTTGNESDNVNKKVENSDNINRVNDTEKDFKPKLSATPEVRNDSRATPGLSGLNISEIQEFFRNGGPYSPHQSVPKSPPKTPDNDFESLSEFTALFSDEFDFDLPQEIDRSMLGEDLIKAYRFWDRKKKAFPGGLRKIEAPVEKQEGLFSKDYSNAKTYKINNSRLDRPPILHSNNKNSTVNELLMDWV